MLIFVYLSCISMSISAGDLSIPPDIYKDYLRKAYYESHARITSNSWGDDSGAYDTFVSDIDRFIADHPDFVAVFAAGNSGMKGYHSVATPSIGKNVISVGSVQNADAPWPEPAAASCGIQITSPSQSIGLFQAAFAFFGPSTTLVEQRDSEVITAVPADGCDTLTNVIRGKIVLIDRGGCGFVAKVVNAQNGGAIFVIVVNSDDSDPFRMAGPDDNGDATASHIRIPAVMVSSAAGERLNNLEQQPNIR
jgi:hypothetical protein